MAEYYELMLACYLKEDVPKHVVDVLRYLLSIDNSSFEPEPETPDVLPDHFFFSMEGWNLVLAGRDPFPGEGIAKLAFADSINAYEFTVRVTVRKGLYLITSFVHWLTPYISTDGFIGYTTGEFSYLVWLIFTKDEKLFYNRLEADKHPPQVTQIEIMDSDTINYL